jgi:hypothetical protein
MKLLFLLLLFLTAIFLSMKCISLCEKGCDCTSDSSCKYYCDNNNKCRDQISYRESCEGYHVHPRECGSVSFCDPRSGYTCQSTKSNGVMCSYNWSCYSYYCDLSLQTCQQKPESSSPSNVPSTVPSTVPSSTYIPAIVGGIVGFFVILTTISIILTKLRQRSNVMLQANQIVTATIEVRTIEVPPICQESMPPAYSAVMAPSTTETKNDNKH